MIFGCVTATATTLSLMTAGALCDIMDASRRGDLKAVQEILLADPNQCQFATADGATPLMVAAMMGHKQVVQVLVQYGSPLDAQDHKNGWTALMQAIYHRWACVYPMKQGYTACLLVSFILGGCIQACICQSCTFSFNLSLFS